jgi:N-acetylglucosaminyldiphosphoundecaprenol N-acetyl-beta-D-mannosaminyltransferase
MSSALVAIDQLIRSGKGGTIYTPNVDHVVLAEHDESFHDAYARASLSLVDGTPLVWASKLLGSPLPEKVSGSDLLLPLMQLCAQRKYRVYLLGGAPGVGSSAARKLLELHPALEIVGIDVPRVSMPPSRGELSSIWERISEAKPDLVVVALGGHKQELFCDLSLETLRPAVFVCVGAAMDFLVGVERRAPRWISRAGLEWLYRLVQDPKRLAARYLGRDPEFLLILARQLSEQWRLGTRRIAPAPPASSAAASLELTSVGRIDLGPRE